MNESADQRNWPRELFVEPIRGILYRKNGIVPIEPRSEINPNSGEPFSFLYIFVNVHNLSPKGALVASSREFDAGSSLEFMVFNSNEGRWEPDSARVAWIKRLQGQAQFLIGLEFLPEHHDTDLKFLMNSEFLECIPEDDKFFLLDCMSRKNVKTGTRLISRGEIGEAMFLIQKGSCSVKMERDGKRHQVARLGRGDVVGEMAILTDESRNADVDAESDLVLWELSRNAFEKVSAKHTDLRIFLTELLAHRFESVPSDAGRTIGKYILKHEIGRGGWSIVYNCTHKLIERPAAVKMLRHDMALEPVFLKAFREEADIIASMNHRNIVQIYDIEEKYQTVFIVMELLEGQSLERLLKRAGKIESSRAVDFLIQICAGLGYSHRKKVIHRDVKPANIFVLPNDRIKILDFGLSCAPGAETSRFKGTPSYAPAEQIRGVSVDARSDIYSMGILAYEMVTGQIPYPDEDLADSMETRCKQEIHDPAELVPNLQEGIRKFIVKACRINPEQRYQNMKEAQETLQSLSRNRRRTIDEQPDDIRNITTLFLLYKNENEHDFTPVLEKYISKIKEIGVDLKIVEGLDI